MVNLTWNDISAVCPPPDYLCDGALGSVIVTGLRWATVSDLYNLLDGYYVPVIPGSYYYEETDSAWAPDIMRDFLPTASNPQSESVTVWVGGIGVPTVAELHDSYDGDAVDYYEVSQDTGAASASIGALFWRYLQPRASAEDLAVIPTGNGLFDVSGRAKDVNGNDACALALASGKCMFSCGPGSSRCEGGVADLPPGVFRLFDLSLEGDGTINLQVFVEGHLSYIKRLDPADYPNTPIPPPGENPVTYFPFSGSSVCLNLSADATKLESNQSKCDGGSSLDVDIEVSATDPFNEPGCTASIVVRLYQDIPIIHQGFSVETEEGYTVTGYFNYGGLFIDGTARDANGCGSEWSAVSEVFEP
jgi:hypothetical protein